MDGTICLFNIAMEKSLINGGFNGKSSINGPFSMAMLNKPEGNSQTMVIIGFNHNPHTR